MNNNGFSEQLVEKYSCMLLNWAYNKTGDRSKAEELVQDVWVNVFSALNKSTKPIYKPENFIWRIAHIVWCRHIRNITKNKMIVSGNDAFLSDGTDFVEDMVKNDEQSRLIAYMRKRISNLSYLQREIIVSFYIDGKSQRQIAEKLGITEAQVKWYLFDTRKRLKEEITQMSSNDYLYRPRKLHVALSGMPAPEGVSDIRFINESLVKQNICIECYYEAQTVDSLSEKLGVPKAYIEYDVDWLVKHEFLNKNKQSLSTSFVIYFANESIERKKVVLKHKEALYDVIIAKIYSYREAIKSIGFYGCEQPIEKLMWFLLYRLSFNFEFPSLDVPASPSRPDGGVYHPLGSCYDDARQEENTLIDTHSWDYNGPMDNDGFSWFGLYNFGVSDIEKMMDEVSPEWGRMHQVLCELIANGFNAENFDDGKKYVLAKLAEQGYVTIKNGKIYPSFCVFTHSQYQRLENEVLIPIADSLKSELASLSDDFQALHERIVPARHKDFRGLFTQFALGDIAYYATYFAFNEGKLYIPKDKRDGEFLTLVYIN